MQKEEIKLWMLLQEKQKISMTTPKQILELQEMFSGTDLLQMSQYAQSILAEF